MDDIITISEGSGFKFEDIEKLEDELAVIVGYKENREPIVLHGIFASLTRVKLTPEENERLNGWLGDKLTEVEK